MHRLPLTLALLVTCATRIPAQITADMAVSHGGAPLGTITLELDHVAAPMATANFIGLASGKLSWVDSATGLVRHNVPYYDGIIFHRVIDGFMNQTGSQNGLGTDGPGYSFPDGTEVTNGLTHNAGYVISMANSGPNTNGSQIFLTVEPASWLNGKHIVFGKIADVDSQIIVDTINNVEVIDPENDNNRPVEDVVIDSVTVHYNGVDFDPSAQGLPVVSSPPLAEPITPSSTSLVFNQPAGSDFHLAYSADMIDWQQSSTRTLGIDDAPLTSFALPTGAQGGNRKFYSPALATYDPDFIFPSSLANMTFDVIVTTYSSTVPITFVFDATGQNATWSWPLIKESGSAKLYNDSPASYNPVFYHASLTLELTDIGARYWQFNNLDMGAFSPTQIAGTHDVTLYFSDGTPTFAGTFTLTK